LNLSSINGQVKQKYRKKKGRKMLKNRMILLWIVVIFLSWSLNTTFVFAKGGGKGHGTGSPHGWGQGKKKGWDGDAPPGNEKKYEDPKPSGLTREKDIQKGNEEGKKQQEMEQEKTRERERERHRQRERKGESKEK